jgi:hypothetical protein
MSEDRIPVLFSVDIEPDDFVFPLEAPSPWHGFEVLNEEFKRRREQLAEVTGEPARFAWSLRMDPQIAQGYGSPTWAAERFGSALEELRGMGDSLGIHPHAWRWDRTAGDWVSDHADNDWVNECATTSFEAFRDVFGEPPPCHKFGGSFMSTSLMNLVRELGASLDFTLEPGEPGGHSDAEGVTTGLLPDFRDVPRVPYRPDRSDFRRPATGTDEPFWTMPLTSGRWVPPSRSHSAGRSFRRDPLGYVGKRLRHPIKTGSGLVRFTGGRRATAGSGTPQSKPSHRLLTMWREWRSPADFWDSAFEAAAQMERPYLAFAVRSDIVLRKRLRPQFHAILEHLQKDPRARRLVFTTPEDASQRLGLDQRPQR